MGSIFKQSISVLFNKFVESLLWSKNNVHEIKSTNSWIVQVTVGYSFKLSAFIHLGFKYVIIIFVNFSWRCIFECELCSKVLKEALLLLFLLAWKYEQKMVKMEQKNSRTKFVPNRTKNPQKGTENVREQNLLLIEQKMLKREQKMFANKICS